MATVSRETLTAIHTGGTAAEIAEIIDEPEIETSSVVEIGSVKPGMIPTLLEGKVLERVHHYLSLDTRNEQGGLVVFNVEKDSVSKRNASRLVDFIPSRLGKKTGVSFQWIQDDFTEAHRYVDKNWSGSMLGFIHSHPGMSVGPTGETLDSFILKGYCKEPFIPFLIYNPISRTINDLRWDANRNQAVSVGGILIDQAGLSQETELQFIDTDFFGGPGRGYKATLVPSGKSLEESIEIGEIVPARGEEIARAAREEARRRVEVSPQQRFSTLITQVKEQLKAATVDRESMKGNLLELFDLAAEITAGDPGGEKKMVRGLSVLLRVAKEKQVIFSDETAGMTGVERRAAVGELVDEVKKLVVQSDLSEWDKILIGGMMRQLLDHTVALGSGDKMGTSLARLLRIAGGKQVKLGGE